MKGKYMFESKWIKAGLLGLLASIIIIGYGGACGSAAKNETNSGSSGNPGSGTAPNLTTQEATEVTDRAAILNGVINPNGRSASVYFQCGLNTWYGKTTGFKIIPSGSNNIDVYETITGLLPANTYHFRLVASSSGSTFYGRDRIFTTGVTTEKPGLATSPNPTNLATKVLLNKILTWASASIATSYDINFGDTNPPSFIANTSDLSYNPGILSFNKTYYWRIDSINSNGKTTGTLWRFTTTDDGWIQVSSGENHTIALKYNGTLWAWGDNQYGQLGDGTGINKNTPTQIGADNTWASIAAGYNHSIALKSDGSLWAWGYNTSGQLGLGNTTSPITTVTRVGTDINWSMIAAGENHTMALKLDGSIWTWGNNSNGQLGNGITGPSGNKNIPTQIIVTDTNWSKIAAGKNYSLALRTDNTLWAWGDNTYCQLGDNTKTKRIVPTQIGFDANWTSIVAGYNHSIALKSDGTLWTWGYNGYGQLGDGTTVSKTVPTRIGADINWSRIASGESFTVALKSNGTLWSWGNNAVGQLGTGNTITQTTPTQIGLEIIWSRIAAGKNNTVALRKDGTMWICGLNHLGQLGNQTVGNKNIPTKIGTDTNWSKIIAGGTHSVALKSDGTLWAWGNNTYGQLGDGTTVNRPIPKQIGGDTDWSRISAGENHTLASKTSGTLWAWGNNTYGQLGDGTNTDKNTPVQVTGISNCLTFSCGTNYNIATMADDSIWGWGDNSYAQLGLNVVTFGTRNIPNQLPTSSRWYQISCGAQHVLAIVWNGTIWGWGNGQEGRFPLAIQIGVLQPTATTYPGTDWLALACGDIHSIALRSNGTIWTSGRNYYGQLGTGNNSDNAQPTQITGTDWSKIASGWNHVIAIKTNGTLWTWGYNISGQLGDSTNINRNIYTQIGSDNNWSAIAGGSLHTTALKSDGTLWSWGSNSFGQLGDGTAWRNTLTQIGQ
jgi:alpha-tubulin suppressor-like RCC1 family protein